MYRAWILKLLREDTNYWKHIGIICNSLKTLISISDLKKKKNAQKRQTAKIFGGAP